MKKTKPTKPTRSKFPILRQLCNLIPPFLVSKSARDKGVDKQARTFSVWSHFVTLIYAQLTHSISLNDVCDGLQLNSGELSSLRGATPPSRNNLSHANRTRDAGVAEEVFWKVLNHLQEWKPGSAHGRGRPARRFKRAIHAVDSSTIKLIMSCFSWAHHRRRKAAAKLHLRLNLQSFLPGYAIVDKAKGHDSQMARKLCWGLKAGFNLSWRIKLPPSAIRSAAESSPFSQRCSPTSLRALTRHRPLLTTDPPRLPNQTSRMTFLPITGGEGSLAT